MSATGNGALDLSLHIPLATVETDQGERRFHFLGAQVTVEPLLPPLTNVKGLLQFTDGSINVREITGQFLGGPVKGGRAETRGGLIDVTAAGNLSVAQARKQYNLPLFDRPAAQRTGRRGQRCARRRRALSSSPIWWGFRRACRRRSTRLLARPCRYASKGQWVPAPPGAGKVNGNGTEAAGSAPGRTRPHPPVAGPGGQRRAVAPAGRAGRLGHGTRRLVVGVPLALPDKGGAGAFGTGDRCRFLAPGARPQAAAVAQRMRVPA